MSTSHAELIARNVRRLRAERQMSLGELARRCGVSKQTLSTIESGNGNPTVDTLAALGGALDVPLRRLVTEWGSAVLVERAAAAAWQERAGILTRDLDRIWGSGEVRTSMLSWPVAAKRTRPVPGHAFGTLHHLYVLEGRLRCGPEAQPVELDAGDFIQFPADSPHWTVPLEDCSRAHVVTTIPRVAQFGR